MIKSGIKSSFVVFHKAHRVARSGDHFAHICYCGIVAFAEHGAISWVGSAMLVFAIVEVIGSEGR